MRKIIISGGPSTGKSTIFEALKEIYKPPAAYFVEEAAERVIKRELNRKKESKGAYDPALPTKNYPRFMPLVIGESMQLEGEIPEDAEIVFLDRSFIDNIGYGTYHNCTGSFPELEQHIKAARYTMAFFCDQLGKFERNAVRRETPAQGAAIHEALKTAYHNSGTRVVHLPPVSVPERLAIIQEHVG